VYNISFLLDKHKTHFLSHKKGRRKSHVNRRIKRVIKRYATCFDMTYKNDACPHQPPYMRDSLFIVHINVCLSNMAFTKFLGPFET
jgi:hypothetical protein